MKSLMNLSIATILCFNLSSCSTALVSNQEHLSLNKIDLVDLEVVNSENAASFFGKPDLQDFIGKNQQQEAMVYLKDNSPRLTLVFDTKTKQLLSANWFVGQNDQESQLKKIQERYPHANFDLNNPKIIKSGVYGVASNQYKSTNSPLKIFVDTDSKQVSALSWVIREDTTQEKRLPTSH
jgi:hypothetical protein